MRKRVTDFSTNELVRELVQRGDAMNAMASRSYKLGMSYNNRNHLMEVNGELGELMGSFLVRDGLRNSRFTSIKREVCLERGLDESVMQITLLRQPME